MDGLGWDTENPLEPCCSPPFCPSLSGTAIDDQYRPMMAPKAQKH